MSVKRKCPECGTWNENGEDRCKVCNKALAPELIIREGHAQRALHREQAPASSFEQFVEKVKNSPNPIVRSTYFAVYAVWAIYMGILAFFLWLIAWLPG
ncbi:MAG: hypothetical protein KDC12_03525 [Flavobacteriales bacterium]|nr:hypothetical protein [Flavobacteriales bacterium]